MSTMGERMKDRMNEKIDPDILRYWESRFDQCVGGYRGLTHATNVLISETADQSDIVKQLMHSVSVLSKDVAEMHATIGELKADAVKRDEREAKQDKKLALVEEALEKSREAFRSLKK